MFVLFLSLAIFGGLGFRPAHAVSSYQPHAPIVIDGNGAFTPDNGVIAGDGSDDHPFLIEGWNITAPSGTGILIRNTDEIFWVQNNFVNISDGNATVLVNLNTGAVRSNTIRTGAGSSDTPTGVWVVNSTNTSIDSNTLMGDQGVEIDSSAGIWVADNTLTDTLGITISNSLSIHVASNTFPLSDLRVGVSITQSSQVTVTDNTIWASYDSGTAITENNSGHISIAHNSIPTASNGISLESSDNIQVSRNTIGAIENDITVGNSSDIEILGNTITYSSRVQSNDPSQFNKPYGLLVGNTGNISIVANDIIGTNYGVTLLYTSPALVIHNSFINNTIYQAYDDTSDNLWDNRYPAGGNYWSDYAGVDNCSGPNQDVCANSDGVGDTPYVFTNGQDNYPLMNPFPRAPVATSGYSDAGFGDGDRHMFYAQANFWLIYVEYIPYTGSEFLYVSSPDGITWTSPVSLGVFTCCLSGLSVNNDDSHVYIALATNSAIYFAFGQLNQDGTIAMDNNGGLLKTASYDASSAGTRLSIAVDSNLHAFIAYQAALGCGLCVADASPPYTAWNKVQLSTGGLNWPKIHTYGPGQMILVSGDYSNVWNGNWGTPVYLSGNNGEEFGNLFYENGKIYLVGMYGHIGFYTFDGTAWSTLQLTNIPSLGPGDPSFSVSYDSLQNKFVIFVTSTDGTNGGLIYQYSGAADSTLYNRIPIAVQNSIEWGTTSLETIITKGPSAGEIGFAWTYTTHPYQIYTYLTSDNP